MQYPFSQVDSIVPVPEFVCFVNACRCPGGDGRPANDAHIEQVLERPVELVFEDWRAGDQRYFVADTSAARDHLGLPEPRSWRDGVAGLADWLSSRRTARTRGEAAA